MEEIWKPIKGFESYYLVSNTGKIYSNHSGRQIKSFISRIGYHDVYLKVNKKTSIKKLHRLVAEAFLDSGKFKEVNHKDGNKSNNEVSNLEWVDRSSNMKHSFSMNLSKPRLGIENNKSILSEKEVKEIRELRKKGWILRELSAKFNVTMANISEIVNRKTWKHI